MPTITWRKLPTSGDIDQHEQGAATQPVDGQVIGYRIQKFAIDAQKGENGSALEGDQD